ncbi:MAG: hypothetical protein MUQ05_03035 [Schleiferiaceae bacterium]|nr:hypothetical protein [Flavobacteriales bacterium]MDG1758505.1 hypothetical protein [Schleiferiaceae bacterium]MDG2225007.1 hypothetical protein [Schleiferiaceae bacterium]MDO7583203.1 hypothetical protein [Schleiferiaceae bacterium]MDO7592937.1 hypothetical protein [Schleiferiaceae bacterium]
MRCISSQNKHLQVPKKGVVFNPLHLFNPSQAGKHFPSDVTVGYAVDALLG